MHILSCRREKLRANTDAFHFNRIVSKKKQKKSYSNFILKLMEHRYLACRF